MYPLKSSQGLPYIMAGDNTGKKSVIGLVKIGD
jgi:hypothetical protein